MFLDERVHHVGVSPHLLGGDQLIKLFRGQGLDCLLVAIKITDCQVQHGVQLRTGGHTVLKTFRIFPYEVILQFPAIESAVPYRLLGGNLLDELVVLYVFQTEFVGGVVP